jgi:hypothetical protein
MKRMSEKLVLICFSHDNYTSIVTVKNGFLRFLTVNYT